ncbi:hypothetical protein D9Q98_010220 [Chlorella vulgaris]|uniref:Uncharacterized protein n=1 Tax=Chlorella vulgaris TaxID=3077 RepID=A0A9D4TJS9_CHLVU|nr:hypothetical protein D9Q98_010220 [Chlorella vulgaris]
MQAFGGVGTHTEGAEPRNWGSCRRLMMASACMLPSSSGAISRGAVFAAQPAQCQRQLVHQRAAAPRCAAGGRKGGGSGSSKGGSGGKPGNAGGSKGRRVGGGSSGAGGGAPRSRPAARRLRSKQQQQQPARKAVAAGPPPCLVPPVRMAVEGELCAAERMPPPLWSTFCGVSNGLWCGITAAYSPYTGEPEPLALDADRKAVTLLHQCCVEERVVDAEGLDSVVRHVARAATPAGLQREMAQGGKLQFPACAIGGSSSPSPSSSPSDECWLEEGFHSEQEGLVVFDGGSYSLGPAAIGSPQEAPQPAAPEFDDDAAQAAAAALEAAAREAAAAAAWAADSAAALEQVEAEDDAEGEGEGEGVDAPPPVDVAAIMRQEQAELDWTTVVIDHCLQFGGDQRLRLRLTLDTAGGGDGTDLEVQPLRVALSREAWEGLPGSYTPAAQERGAPERQEASRRQRLDSSRLAGSWKVFEVTAVTVADVSLATGLPAPATLYTAGETLRRLDSHAPEDGGDGALLLLPHSCGVQLETLRLDNSRRRGLRVSCHWCPQPDMLLSMARLYGGDGQLLEVATSTAIRAQPAQQAQQ